jgi:hypothetical protein
MFKKCEICGFESISPKSLSQHIKNNHSEYSIKDYYDKFLKTEGEGICIREGCSKPTTFQSIKKGYLKYCCLSCGSLNTIEDKKKTCIHKFGVNNSWLIDSAVEKARSTRKKNRDEFLEKKLNDKIATIKKDNRLQCQICGEEFDTPGGIGRHISRTHKITSENYYRTYFLQDNEGLCKISGNPTTFINIQDGFRPYYKSEAVKGSDNPILEKAKHNIRVKTLLTIERVCIEKSITIINKEELINEDMSLLSYDIQANCQLCGNTYHTNWMNLRANNERWGRCPKCFPKITAHSHVENELGEFIKSIYSKTVYSPAQGLIKNEATGCGLELDFYMPDVHVAVEFDGLYWHSEACKKDRNYHLNKTIQCEKLGIQLIHVFEDEWMYKQEIVKSRISQLLTVNKRTIHARKCIVKEIDASIKNKFLEENHIQGGDASSIKLGAFFEDNLVAVMTFSKGNPSKGGKSIPKVWELNRFCLKIGEHIPGIASKLLKHFQKNYEWILIYSYADRRWSMGKLYYSLGFEKERTTPSQYSYVDLRIGQRYHRANFRKRPDEPKDVPEWKLRMDEGYLRIWDCGLLKFSMINI